MLVAHYIGTHAGEALRLRLGRALVRLAQKGEFSHVTHTEAILDYAGGGVADIASASLMDGGVRIKRAVTLNPNHWLITVVPGWSVLPAREWFAEHQGQPYDWRGALATVLPGHRRSGQWFCNEAVGASMGLREPHTFTPAQFAAICFTLGRDVTREFFNQQGQ